MKLRQILRYIGVSNANMEEGNFRCEANSRLRRTARRFGSKVEVKNMNSFRAVRARAASSRSSARRKILDAAATASPQETRGWVEERRRPPASARRKQAHDYRYFPEPDLPPLTLTARTCRGIRAALPELPDAQARALRGASTA